MSSYTGWYKDGTASVVNGSTAVTGVDTYWSTAGIHAGDLLTFDNTGLFVEIASVNSDTSITLAQPFTAGTKANVPYAIIRNFTSGSMPEVASQVVDALGKYTRYFNEDTATLQGKSAYEVAKANGYSGTEAQWLESLKAAGEWSTLNDRTNILTYHSAAAHNSIYRGKNLGGAITASMIANIRNGTFVDWYPGDFLTLPIDGSTTAYVIGCNVMRYGVMYTNHVLLWLINTNWVFPINDTPTCEGALLNSKMYTVHLPYILGKIREVIPDANIIPWEDEISDSTDSSGNVNHWTQIKANNANAPKIGIPSFCNIVGYDVTNNHGYNVAGRNPNWPAFRLNGNLRSMMGYKWVDSHSEATAIRGQSGASTSHWHIMSWTMQHVAYMNANSITTGDSPICVYPYILLG